MKFDKQALLSFALLCSFTFDVDAFTSKPRRSSSLALFDGRASAKFAHSMPFTRLNAVDDDDGDEEDPLGKGVDSVSWLPCVLGAKGDEISSVNEVSGTGRISIIYVAFSRMTD